MKKIYWLNDESTKLGTAQNLIKSLSGSYSFCALPWIHLATGTDGRMKLCCNANASGAGFDHGIALVKKDDKNLVNFSNDAPFDVWNNNYMRNVRTTMLNEEIPASCKKCYDEESKGIVSKRIWETITWINNDINIPDLIKSTVNGVVPNKLTYLDLRLGHTCNLKCVMCSPYDSSLWVSDHKKLLPIVKSSEIKNQLSWDETKFNNKWYENTVFWDQIYDQIPNLKQIYFAGGEPLAIKEHVSLLNEIIKRGYSNNITIRYNTNGLLINDYIMSLWSKFKKVKVGFSLDALDERNYYIRYPADWNTIVKNLHLLDNSPDNIEVSIAVTVQLLNIKHITEFAKWKIEQKFKKINSNIFTSGVEHGGGIFNMHLLYISTFLSIKCLPEKDKLEVQNIFLEFKNWLYKNYRTDDEFWKINPYGWKRWQAILDFMNSEDHTHLLNDFKEYINKLDQIRNLDSKKLFPELAHLF